MRSHTTLDILRYEQFSRRLLTARSREEQYAALIAGPPIGSVAEHDLRQGCSELLLHGEQHRLAEVAEHKVANLYESKLRAERWQGEERKKKGASEAESS